MSFLKWPFKKRLMTLCWIIFVSFGVLAGLSVKVNHTIDDTSKQVAHTHDVLFQSEQLLSAVKDLQIATRGYILTTDTSFITKIDAFERIVIIQLKKLKDLTSDNSNQQIRIKKLQNLLIERIRFISKLTQSPINSISKQKVTYTGEDFLHNIRDVMDQIQQEEDTLLIERNNANNSSRKSLNLIFYTLVAAGCMLLIATFILIRRYLQLSRDTEQTIRHLNESLEKRVEEKACEIIEKEKQYHLVLDNMLEGAQILKPNWEYSYVNEALTKQARYSTEQLLGNKMTELYPGIEQTQLFKDLEVCMKNRVAKKVENEFKYPNGDSAFYELSIEPIKEGLFVLSMDITARKVNELYKEQYIKELEEVLFKISHEVRSPVVKILGVAQLLELSLIKEDELPMVIDAMKKCAILLDQYTRDLSDFITEMRDNSASSNS